MAETIEYSAVFFHDAVIDPTKTDGNKSLKILASKDVRIFRDMSDPITLLVQCRGKVFDYPFASNIRTAKRITRADLKVAK